MGSSNELIDGIGRKPQAVSREREDNKLRVEDQPAHDWYRFVLSYPPHLVRSYVERFGLNRHSRVLDPFCGTGTTAVECKKMGVSAVGIEANPFAAFASRTKVNWLVNADALIEHARVIAAEAERRLDEDGYPEGADASLFVRPPVTPGTLQTLPTHLVDLLLSDSISPAPLHRTLTLLDVMEQCRDDRFHDHERLALARTTVFENSNLHFGPEVGVAQPKADAPVVSNWLRTVARMSSDLRSLTKNDGSEAIIHQGDARNADKLVPSESIDAVITSPPYPNEKDYTRTTRLESVLLGFFACKADIRAMKKSLVRSNTRSVYVTDDDHLHVAGHAEIERISAAIEARRIQLGKTSGFERLYHRVTKLYFGGMAKHLAALQRVLRPGAQLAYVVGDQASYLQVMIRTGKLLADIARDLGYEVVGIDLFRTRLATATREQLREEVVLLRWDGGNASKSGR